MAFQYSSFISYRHDAFDKKYIANLKTLLKEQLFRIVTNIESVFYDEESINWGTEWDNKIYTGISKSVFFVPIWYHHYLNEENLWCARELYHALEIEKIIKEQLDEEDKDKFYFVLPLIYKGSNKGLPYSLSRKTAKSLDLYEVEIKNKKTTTRLQKFINDLFYALLEHFRVIEKYKNINFQELFDRVKIPTDDEIINWIKEQTREVKQIESENLPILKKNAE